ncbi:MAG: hypothetical protein V4560_06100 [Bacteroidota bacterium]
MAKRLRRYSTSFKIIVILLVMIFTGYLFRTFTTGTKQIILADTVAESHPLKKHIKRHRNKNYTKLLKPLAPVVDTPKVIAIKPEPPKQIALIKPAPTKQLPDTIKQNSTFLYITYVQPNATGIVKLREQDNFNSTTLANIPAKSKVQVLEKGATYYKVAYNNNIGFVPKWTLQIK